MLWDFPDDAWLVRTMVSDSWRLSGAVGVDNDEEWSGDESIMNPLIQRIKYVCHETGTV